MSNPVNNSTNLQGTNAANNGLGAADPTAAPKDVLMAALLLMMDFINLDSNASSAQASLSLALKNTVDKKAMQYVEAWTAILEACGQYYSDPASLSKLTSQELAEKFPDIAQLPADMQEYIHDQIQSITTQANNDPAKFQQLVSTIGPRLTTQSTLESQANALSQGAQTASGNISQSIQQSLAQLMSEFALAGQEVVQ